LSYRLICASASALAASYAALRFVITASDLPTSMLPRIQYDWLPFSAYQCLNAMIEALENILSNVGSKYQITFA
jgi:hypothetical protein